MPAAAVIPAPRIMVKIVAVKKPVVEMKGLRGLVTRDVLTEPLYLFLWGACRRGIHFLWREHRSSFTLKK